MRIRGKEKVPGLLEAAKPLLHDSGDGPLVIPSGYERLYLEVGCGRGGFLSTCALRNPEAFFVGLDKYTPIVARAASLAMEKGLTNVRILDLDVERAVGILPIGAFNAIFLNFSDPWPRRRNAIKRLTHPRLLQIFSDFLAPGARLEMKTDNASLFAYSIEMLEASGWTLQSVTKALPDTPAPGEEGQFRYIQTEYEQRFRALGIPIGHLIATPPGH
ncbi:MAG: tRNA (guanosine(46)-N7)-methyltransferase TrmB [Firmicutes bacterium]|nr:tRNA (guanosine(46)-N7)-methyltransferase TrmB [Bacillota bacterium]